MTWSASLDTVPVGLCDRGWALCCAAQRRCLCLTARTVGESRPRLCRTPQFTSLHQNRHPKLSSSRRSTSFTPAISFPKCCIPDTLRGTPLSGLHLPPRPSSAGAFPRTVLSVLPPFVTKQSGPILSYLLYREPIREANVARPGLCHNMS